MYLVIYVIVSVVFIPHMYVNIRRINATETFLQRKERRQYILCLLYYFCIRIYENIRPKQLH